MENLLPNNLWTEALIVGLVIVIVGKATTLALNHFLLPSPIAEEHLEATTILDRHYMLEITLFLTGLATHLILEYLGANSWYCKYGAACLAPQ